MNQALITRFCTPHALPLGESDAKAIADAQPIGIPFDGTTLAGYSWGSGKTILMVHGWGSRASHLSFLGHFLARAGFRAFAYDAPAHSSTGIPAKPASNMFEYCSAISAAAACAGPLHAVIGHSFGATCAALTIAGTSLIAPYKISAPKLVLISPAPTLIDVYRSFCRKDGIGEAGLPELKRDLETDFHFISEEYTLYAALRDTGTDTLLVHDTSDEEFPVTDIRMLQDSVPGLKLLFTEGSGHQKILANRSMMTGVKEHLAG